MVLLSPPVSLDNRRFAPHYPFASRCINKYQQHTAGGNPAMDKHSIRGAGEGEGESSTPRCYDFSLAHRAAFTVS